MAQTKPNDITKNESNDIIATLIRIIHFILIIFVILAPLSGSKILIQINIVILGYMLLKWISGDDTCGITELEYSVSNKPYGQGFIYRLLNGVIGLEENKFNVIIIVLTAIWLAVNIMIIRNMD